ncbi:thioesterase family protein [Streptomyces coffeae]|uniref:Thioesterase family protein n=1 Tax=Streptomyces coffeae TaxID=621382 RepID=A0ABS1NHQ2_9ACTN|nr:thioesterase family protein [Streptomyces coffeae]MBL1099464.1 thioesterase family protein [Streptomyces coffeae]
MSTPLPDYQQTVRPEWIDYNGHMSEAFYVLVFGHSTDEMMVETGLDSSYRAKTGYSLYTVESHIRYLREVEEGAELTIRTRVLGVDEKKVRFSHEMHVGEPDGAPVATTELLAVHTDQKQGHAAPFPDEVRERLSALVEKAPEWAGQAIGPVPAEPA